MNDDIRHRTRRDAAALGQRLARAIGADPDDADLEEALAFPARFAARLAATPSATTAYAPHPLDRIASLEGADGDGLLLADLALLAVLPEIHEGFAALCSLFNRDGRQQATVALALHLVEAEHPDDPFAARDRVERLLLAAPVAALGLVRAHGIGPWHGRDLIPGTGLADAVLSRALSAPSLEQVSGLCNVPGLDDWLDGAEARRAVAALATRADSMVAAVGHTAEARACRVRALLGRLSFGAARASAGSDVCTALRDAASAGFLHGLVPWLDVSAEEGGAVEEVPFAGPVLVTAPDIRALPRLGRPILIVHVEPLAASARRAMWAAVLPQLHGSAGALATRFAVEPHEVADLVADLALRQRLDDRPLGGDDIAAAFRARTASALRPGVRRVVPRVSFAQVLLPPAPLAQLAEAVHRIERQVTVLDDWGFEAGRSDRRGLKILFHGSPGTGKTLAAEALASALGLDLLVADVAGLVSKWIGETEKNLSAVFDVAERSRAILFFDEADALFGRRTEVNDATDRYANLETAHLLQRLEAFTGVAILATNMRSGLDSAFTRRFDEIVAFAEPDAALRLRLWRLHLPAAAPLGDDVDLETLADWYPMSGAEIRKAALSAAYIAAGERRSARILQCHLVAAVAREFEKMGRAFPGAPPTRFDAPSSPTALAS